MFVTTIDKLQSEKLHRALVEKGFSISHPPYTLFSAKGQGVSCTAYTSGKLVVQGKDIAPFVEFFLEPEILGTFTYGQPKHIEDLSPRIGSDETGKGDLFGPLTVCALYADEKQLQTLNSWGICDSKKLTDKAIAALAAKIRPLCQHQLLILTPKRYNELYSSIKNLNHLLAWAHSAVLSALYQKTQCRNIIVDKFANEYLLINALRRQKVDFPITQRVRAEEDLAVAAASIVARDGFVNHLAQLEKHYDMPLPKGASQKTVDAARAFVRRHGASLLPMVAKMHFKSLDAIPLHGEDPIC